MADPEFLSEPQSPHERSLKVLDEGRHEAEDDPYALMRPGAHGPATPIATPAQVALTLGRWGVTLAAEILRHAQDRPESELRGCTIPTWFLKASVQRKDPAFCLHLEKAGRWKGIVSLAPTLAADCSLTFTHTLTCDGEATGRSRLIALDVPETGPLTLRSEQDGCGVSRAIARDRDPGTTLRGLLTALLEHVADPRTTGEVGRLAPWPTPQPCDIPNIAGDVVIPITIESGPRTRRIPVYDFAELVRVVDDIDPDPESEAGIPDGLVDAPASAAAREIFAGERDVLLRALIRRGADGALRELRGARPETRAAVVALGERAPHLAGLTDLVLRQVEFSINTGLPIRLPPVLLLDEPGTGKTWYLSRLAQALGLPYVRQPMTGVSLSEGFQGGHPNWRNARHGIVAQALLKESVANPLIFVDEFDKPQVNSYQSDPYRPFYVFHEPESAADFIDEYLRFPLNARHVLWAMAANSLEGFPEPILQRLTVIRVPAITPEHMRTIVGSIYQECNALNEGWFDPTPSEPVRAALATRVPREVRKAIEIGMVAAGAVNRREITLADLPAEGEERGRIGFT